ncbi:hypothetical protein Droror1_Dr00006106 [Drosera rotundifolia]
MPKLEKKTLQSSWARGSDLFLIEGDKVEGKQNPWNARPRPRLASPTLPAPFPTGSDHPDAAHTCPSPLRLDSSSPPFAGAASARGSLPRSSPSPPTLLDFPQRPPV